MHQVEDAFRTARARTDGVRRIDADRHARQAFHDRHVREVEEVAMWIAHVRLHAAQAEDDFVVSFARQVFRGVQRFAQSDSETTLEQNRKFFLPSDEFQQLEILRVARADLEHHSGRVAGGMKRFVNLIDVGFVCDLHRDHFDSILAG